MYNSFSPNMLKTYQVCPKNFYYKYVENISAPVSSLPFEKGKKIHALANYFLKGIDISRLETSLSNEELRVWNLLLGNEYFKKDYFKSEYQLSCKISNYWVGGRLDAVVKDFDNYYILDYKTGSIPKNPQYDYQTMIYLLCMDRFLEKYETLSFVYIDLKNNSNYVIKFDDNLKSEYEERILEICDEISNDTVFNYNQNQCGKHCSYSKFCSIDLSEKQFQGSFNSF